METRDTNSSTSSTVASPTRLEGMETKEELDALWEQIRRLRPALRGWKRGNGLGGRFAAKESPTRLEGMETHGGLGEATSGRRSPTRLEGMETESRATDLVAALLSPTRLEGMETSLAKSTPKNLRAVSDPP